MKAKDIIVKPISAKDASKIVKACHYSGKVVNNSQLHFGVFLGGRCGGAMQFGPSLDKKKMLGLVEGTGWNEFLELNRMAFADWLPKNSESRAIAVSIRIIRKNYPHIKWIVSFADGTQCGDGTIYRASGFCLTGIKKNNQVWAAPDGSTHSRTSLTDNHSPGAKERAKKTISRTSMTEGGNNFATGAASMKFYEAQGFKPLKGFQLRYIYFIDKSSKEKLTVPILPFTEIDKRGAGMYLGKSRAAGVTDGTPGNQLGGGGSNPTAAHQFKEAGE